MHKVNQTSGISFLLLGFQNSQIINEFLFVPFLWIYILTLFGNLLIIILVITVSALRSPMYALLSQLSLADVLLSTSITPNFLRLLLNGGGTISATGCITQLYVYGVSGASEFYLLTAMAYDRYLAICSPLHYASIMGFRLCLYMSLCSWGLAIILSMTITLLISNFQFCGPFVIDHYFCDFSPLFELLCTGNEVYMVPSKGHHFNINKILSLLYTVGTPFFNPVVYSLRNKDIKVVLLKHM
ncbi:hypothetical protein XENTR_v10010376 [Xenopus tropicalis]|nr:hypothetical protein XENTR_v10010376 [Xenopus tropicalis]